jgi:hypothetical protein
LRRRTQHPSTLWIFEEKIVLVSAHWFACDRERDGGVFDEEIDVQK